MNADREIACAILLDASDRFLLQERDDIPGIILPGRIGLFGGHREDNESYLECIVREVCEEITHYIPPEWFEHLATYEGNDLELDGATIHAEFFMGADVPSDDLKITEGSLLIVEPAQLSAVETRLTPYTKFAIDQLMVLGK